MRHFSKKWIRPSKDAKSSLVVAEFSTILCRIDCTLGRVV
jgi:hypothetical protein